MNKIEPSSGEYRWLDISHPIKETSTSDKCQKCGDKLSNHEDENGTHCRWCVTGWQSSEPTNDSENSSNTAS
jgi:hypothetical protein